MRPACAYLSGVVVLVLFLWAVWIDVAFAIALAVVWPVLAALIVARQRARRTA